jgi:adenosylcobinamide kinase/adenosylcobinamide-phosphate guanylyltransferase
VTGRKRGILLVTGASRSGKSLFAQEWVEGFPAPRLYLATAQALDEEMAERIRRHQEGRGPGWVTLEEPLDVARGIRRAGEGAAAILLDCVTLWLSNLILADFPDAVILERTDALMDALSSAPCPVAVVTNEVGWGIVPDNPLGRRFRDLAGTINQRLGRVAHRVVLMVAGIPVPLKPGERAT